MVKLTAPKRTKKSLTAENYWAEKTKNQKNEDSKPAPKKENIDRRYHFVRPSEKMEKMDVNVAHYINEINILPYSHTVDSIGSFFYDELENFKFLDLTDQYQDFYGEVYDISLTLPLILHNLEKIVDILVKYIEVNECRKSILRIIPSLLRDTQKEIYILFCEKILPKLVDILNERNPDILEDLFKCLAYALKYLLDEIKVNFRPFYLQYVEKFFSSTNKFIQRFTTESLSFVLRKLKTNEIRDFITIVLEPIYTEMEENFTKELISNHISKLIFYTIKHAKETFFSKSLNYVESILKLILSKDENQYVQLFLVNFVKEVLKYSHSQTDAVMDEFQEKIYVSKPQLFEHFSKIFITWLTGLEDIKPQIGKVNIISEAFTQMLIYKKGEVVTQGLLKVIFKIIKILDNVSENILDEETSNSLKTSWLKMLSKVLKYKAKEIYNDSDYLGFIQERVKGAKHTDEMINVVFQNTIEESLENIAHSDYLLKEDYLDENYTVHRLGYDVLLNLILANFNWEDLTTGKYKDNKMKFLNLYMFNVVHKYSNSNNKIKLHSENFRISEKATAALEATLHELLKEHDNFCMERLAKILIFVKYLSIFEIHQEDHRRIYSLLDVCNTELGQFLFSEKRYHNKHHVTIDNMYSLPKEFLAEFTYEVIQRGVMQKSKHELLTVLKGEVLAVMPCFQSRATSFQEIIDQLNKELELMLLAKHNVYYLRSFSSYLNNTLELVKEKLSHGKHSKVPDEFIVKKDKVLLSNEKYGNYLNLLAYNCSNPIQAVRQYTLEILAKISPYNFQPPKENQQTSLVGECNAIELLLEAERLQLTFENERGRSIFYTQVRVYSDQNKLPEEYALIALNCCIGTFYVKMSTVWEAGKENLIALMKSNVAYLIYDTLRAHFIYLNYALFKKKTEEEHHGVDMSVLVDENIEEPKRTLLEAIFDDYTINCDTVDIQEVFKGMTEAMSKAPNLIEKNSTDFHNIFMRFMEHEYYHYFENKNVLINMKEIEEEVHNKNKQADLLEIFSRNLAIANAEKDSDFTHFRFVANLKLDNFLKIFLNFAKIREMKHSKEFYDLLLIFLRKGHQGIQKNALECIIKYDDEEIMKFAERLRKFLKKETYKDQILEFKLDPDSKMLTFVERKTIVPIIISILFPKLFESRGAKHKRSHLDATRTIVFNFFSSLEPAEIDYLISIVFRNHNMPYKNLENLSQEAIMNLLSKTHIEKIIAFLISLENIISQLGSILKPYLSTIFKILCSCVQIAFLFRNSNKAYLQENKNIEEEENLSEMAEKEISLRLSGKFKKLSQLAMARIIQIYNKFSTFSFPQDVTDNLISVLGDTIKNLSTEVTASVPAILRLFEVWSEFDVYIHYFYDYDLIMTSLAEIYSQRKVQAKALESVNTIMLNLAECSRTKLDEEVEDNQETAQQQALTIIKLNVETLIANIKGYFENRIAAQGKKWKPDVKITKILVALSSVVETTSLSDDILSLFEKIIESKNVNKAYQSRSKSEVYSNTVQKNITLVNNSLEIFSNFFSLSQNQERFYPRVLDLLANLIVPAPRELVVKMIESLQLEKFKLSAETINLVKSMNAYSRLADRSLNYNEIATATYSINTEYLNKCSFEDQEIILTNYLFFLHEDEITTRMAATAGFKLFFENMLEQLSFGNLENVHKKIKFTLNSILSACIRGIKLKSEHAVKSHFEVIDLYIHYMNLYVQKGVNLKEYPHAHYLELKFLQNKTDLNQDFFDNFFDVQNMKRIKAITILNKRLKIMEENKTDLKEHITETTFRNVLLPVLRFQILSKYLQENVLKARGSNSESHLATAKNLVNQSIECHSLCTKYLTWPHYFNLLKAHVSTINKETKYEKIIIKLLCANLNSLDAGLPNIVDTITTEMKKNNNKVVSKGVMQKLLNYEKERDKEIEHELEVEADGEEAKAKEENGVQATQQKIAEIDTMSKQANANGIDIENIPENDKETQEKKSAHIIDQLRKKILLPLKKHMHDLTSEDNKEKKIRVFTAVAIAKLISRFPPSIFNVEYPRLIHNIVESLKSVDYEIRQNTRDALAEIVQSMGPYFFHFVAKQMGTSLINGYQKHVLSYTLFFLLKTLIEPKDDETLLIETGSLDYCLEDILPIFIDEILGKLRDEKEVEEIKKKIPEFKTSKAYDGFHLLSSVIDFNRTFVYLVNFLKTRLEESSSDQKKCRQIEEIFKRIQDGLSRNPSFDVELYLIISYYLIDQSLDSMMIKETKEMSEFTFQEYNFSQEDLRKYDIQRNFMVQDGAASGKSIFKMIQNVQQKNKFVVGRIVASFCLNGVLMTIKKNMIHPNSTDPKEISILKKFEPLVKMVINCIKSNDNTIITNCIRILNTIISWPLESIQRNFKKVVSGALQIMQSLGLLDFDMIKACFKLVSHTIQLNANNQLTNHHIKMLLQYIEQFMFVSDNIGEVLETLTALIHKKIVRPEVYDLMDKIIENMVTNYSITIQRACKNALLVFLVEYPMTDKIIKKYITILIKNLEYENESGRTAVIETLSKIVEVLPIEVLESYIDIIVYACVARIVNEENLELKLSIKKIVNKVFEKINEGKTNGFIQTFLTWIQDSNVGIFQSGMEGIAVLMERKHKLDKHLKTIFTNTNRVLGFVVEKLDNYWKEIKENIQKEKEEAKIESKILKKLRAENNDKPKADVTMYYTLGHCLASAITIISANYCDQFTNYLKKESKDFLSNYVSLISFPDEKLVVSIMSAFSSILKSLGNNFSLIYPTSEVVYEEFGNRLLNMFKFNFFTDDFNANLNTVLWSVYANVKNDHKEAYCLQMLTQIQKMLLKMLASANFNATKIKRIVTFFHKLLSSSQDNLTGDLLIKYIDIMIRIEHVKDMFYGDHDISQISDESIDMIKKRSDQPEFIKNYSSIKLAFDSRRFENKRKAKELFVTNPEQAAKEKIAKNERKKSKSKRGINPINNLKKVKGNLDI